MIGATLADPQPQRGHLGPIHVNPRRVGSGVGGHAMGGQQFDHRTLQRRHQRPHSQPQPAHIEQTIHHHLPRTVVSHLTAAIDLDHWNSARRQQMLGLAGHALGKHRRMLDPPQFVQRIRITVLGKRAHGGEDRFVGPMVQAAQQQHFGMHIGRGFIAPGSLADEH